MNYRRVLLVHSFADAGMASRLEQIASDPRLDEVEFAHLAIVDHGRGSARVAEHDRLADLAMEPGASRSELERRREDALRELICEETKPHLLELIESFRPDLMLLHGGTIFEAATGPLLQTLIDVRELHPALPFALEGRDEWLLRTGTRDVHPFERQTVKHQMRWVRDNFAEDDDVELLVSAIF